MAKEKACKKCKTIFSGTKCSKCGSVEFVDNFKGKISILNAEKSEIAKELGVKEKGVFTIKLR
jgi:DNA-directed RNA polymerase subunit E"